MPLTLQFIPYLSKSPVHPSDLFIVASQIWIYIRKRRRQCLLSAPRPSLRSPVTMTVSHHVLQRAYALRLLPGREVFSHHALCNRTTTCRPDCRYRQSDRRCAALCRARSDRPSLTGTFEVISLNGTLELTGEHLHSRYRDPYGPCSAAISDASR